MQARETAEFAASQRQAQLDAGVPAERADRGIATQIGLARRISPHQARRYVGWAKILTTELSQTYTQLAAGKTTQWRAMLLARETAWLTREHRAAVDRELAPQLEALGDRRVETETRRAAYRLDPAGMLDRLSQSANDRRVTLRPVPVHRPARPDLPNPPGAKPPSGIPTTSNPPTKADRPASTTGKGSAPPATSPNKPPAGGQDPDPPDAKT